MASLASVVLSRSVSVVRSEELLDFGLLISRLNQGRALLVPYDCTHNHSPALLGGKKAHWGLVSGFVLPVSQLQLQQVRDHVVDTSNNVHLLQRNIEPDSPVFTQPRGLQLIAR